MSHRVQNLSGHLAPQMTAQTAVMDGSVKQALPDILSNIPDHWYGTTYNNSNLLGREGFCKNIKEMIISGEPITKELLHAAGNAEDYFRVSSNLTTLLEIILSEQSKLPVDQVLTFGSNTIPVLAVCLTTSNPVDLVCGAETFPFSGEELALLGSLGVDLHQHTAAVKATEGRTLLVLRSSNNNEDQADAVIGSHTLYIKNLSKIDAAKCQVIRKRFATPVTNPMSEEWLQKLAGTEVTANQSSYTPESLAAFLAHMQTLGGTPVNTAANPVIFTAGLPSLCAMWLSVLARGGCNAVMASTAYGGSSELTGLIEENCVNFRRTNYDVQGSAEMLNSIKLRLDELSAKPEELYPTTVLLSEIPTNPDMKVPDMKKLVALIKEYKAKTGKNFVFVVDCTFAPGSQVLRQLAEFDPELTAMTFTSLSKSVSRGVTTAGAIVANHTADAIDLLAGVRKASVMMDTSAKRDQLCFLCENHVGVEDRCRAAYNVHLAVGDHLVAEVKKATGVEMPLCTVSPEDASHGFTSSTFSFNLPAPKGADAEVLAGLAQKFVDLLTDDPTNFKPCVSFGQDNGLTYCTVPATSTQGAIKEEDKAKQAIGGVQLTRLSFPPTCDLDAVKRRVSEAVAAAYPQ